MAMDVDEEGADFSALMTEAEAKTATTVSSRAGSEVFEAPMSVDGDRDSPAPEPTHGSEDELIEPVPASVFYGSSSKSKGKEKAKTKYKSLSPRSSSTVAADGDETASTKVEAGEVVESASFTEKYVASNDLLSLC